MSGNFHKFTESARGALAFAQEEAQFLRHNYIGTEHLLLGLLRLEGDEIAPKSLRNLGVDIRKVRSAVEFIIGKGEAEEAAEVGLTPRAEKVIELAVRETRLQNKGSISAEHLLLGLILEREGIAVSVLESLGVSLERLRFELERITGFRQLRFN